MSRTWGYLAGGGALLLAGVVGAQFASRTDPAPQETASLAAPTATLPARVAPGEAAERLAAAEAEVARLSDALAAAEAENAELRSTLALRDTVLDTLNATIAERDAALADVRGQLAENETELAALRGQIDSLLHPSGLDQSLAAAKLGDGTGVARVEPAAARAARQEQGPLVEVQFDFASAALTPGGQERTALAAAALSGMTIERVRIVGHTDRVGRPEANRRLATRRADTVARFLIDAGLPADLIVVDGAGEAGGPVATDDGVPEPLNRSVLIFADAKPTT